MAAQVGIIPNVSIERKYNHTELTSSFTEESDFTIRTSQDDAHSFTNVIEIKQSKHLVFLCDSQQTHRYRLLGTGLEIGSVKI